MKREYENSEIIITNKNSLLDIDIRHRRLFDDRQIKIIQIENIDEHLIAYEIIYVENNNKQNDRQDDQYNNKHIYVIEIMHGDKSPSIHSIHKTWDSAIKTIEFHTVLDSIDQYKTEPEWFDNHLEVQFIEFKAKDGEHWDSDKIFLSKWRVLDNELYTV